MPGKKKKYNARFPPARIKKIMQSDEEVGKVAAAVPVIISRALELFVENVLQKANEVTSRRGARTLTPSHLKFCINSESRFDFLKDLVSSVPDLQGDMDINLDAGTTGINAGEPFSPQETHSSSLTTSNMTWPSGYSAGTSIAVPSNESSTSSNATSRIAMSQDTTLKHFKNDSTDKNDNSESLASSSSYRQDVTCTKTQDEKKVFESSEYSNTKVVKKRGRPRKSSTDVTSANKPKKPKTSSKDTNLLRSILSNAQAPQCSLNKHTSEATPINTGDELAINSKTDLKSTKGINFMKSKSVSEDCRLDFRQQQISRTYSSGSTPTVASSPSLSGDSTVPSFTLTFPAATPSTQDARSLSSAKQNHEKYTKTASSQSATLQPKLKNNSKNDCIYDQESKSTESNCNYTTSNNGFQFTISNILDKGQNPTGEHADESFKLARKPQDIMQNNCRTDTEKSKTKNDSAINSGSIGNGGSATDKAFPTISWTMNVVGPQYNASAEIDEDYDA